MFQIVEDFQLAVESIHCIMLCATPMEDLLLRVSFTPLRLSPTYFAVLWSPYLWRMATYLTGTSLLAIVMLDGVPRAALF
jgi:hypothetical protein